MGGEWRGISRGGGITRKQAHCHLSGGGIARHFAQRWRRAFCGALAWRHVERGIAAAAQRHGGGGGSAAGESMKISGVVVAETKRNNKEAGGGETEISKGVETQKTIAAASSLRAAPRCRATAASSAPRCGGASLAAQRRACLGVGVPQRALRGGASAKRRMCGAVAPPQAKHRKHMAC